MMSVYETSCTQHLLQKKVQIDVFDVKYLDPSNCKRQVSSSPTISPNYKPQLTNVTVPKVLLILKWNGILIFFCGF